MGSPVKLPSTKPKLESIKSDNESISVAVKEPVKSNPPKPITKRMNSDLSSESDLIKVTIPPIKPKQPLVKNNQENLSSSSYGLSDKLVVVTDRTHNHDLIPGESAVEDDDDLSSSSVQDQVQAPVAAEPARTGRTSSIISVQKIPAP